MISVENFYWILDQNLLKHTGMTCFYYYPWGTQNNLSRYEFESGHGTTNLNHVLFGFDQEPIWNLSLGVPYEKGFVGEWSILKFCKILANSEISQLKTDICRSRHMLDWYFFYHGFAALRWYHDAKYVKDNGDIQVPFLSLNHNISTYRSYRISLLARLLDKSVNVKKCMSFHCDIQTVKDELADRFTQLSDSSKNLISRNIDQMSNILPLSLDQISVNSDFSANFGYKEYQLWQRSLLHVVNETVFYYPKLHLTEKTFQPIVAQRPFILVAAPGNLAYLKRYGFQTFNKWIDERYDDIDDPDQRLDAIANEITRFAKMSQCELRELYQDMLPVLEYNKKHFFGGFAKIIVNELVDNYDQCIRLWNNGRIDSRTLPTLTDLDHTKKILLDGYR